MKTKRFLNYVLVFAMLTAMLCQGVAAAATDTVLTTLAISDTAVTFGFDKGTGDSGTFYKKYTVTVKPEGGETETVSANNIITYVEKNGNELRRLVTVKGLKESTTYDVTLNAYIDGTDPEKTLTGTITTKAADDNTVNIAIGAAVSATKLDETGANTDKSDGGNYPSKLITTGTSVGAVYGYRDLWIGKGADKLTITMDSARKVGKIELFYPKSQGLGNNQYGITKYNLKASLDGETWDTIANEVKVEDTQVNDAFELASPAEYQYFKIEINGNGTTDTRLADFRVYGPEKTLENKINNLAVAAVSDTAATIIFDVDKEAGHTGYEVYVDGEKKFTENAIHNVIVVTGLEPSKNYTLGLRGVTDTGRTAMATVQASTMGARDVTPGVNVALGATVRAQHTTQPGTVYNINRVVNGVSGKQGNSTQNDQWNSSNKTDTTSWIKIDLRVATKIGSILLEPASSYGVSGNLEANKYTIEGSTNDSDYTVIKTVTGVRNTGKINIDLGTPAEYRYIKVTLDDNYKLSDGAYGYRLGDIKVFSAADSGFGMTDVSVNEIAGNKIKAAASCFNYGQVAKKVVVIVALYDENDMLVNVAMSPETDVLGAATVTATAAKTAYKYAKVFVWDGLTAMSPYVESLTK